MVHLITYSETNATWCHGAIITVNLLCHDGMSELIMNGNCSISSGDWNDKNLSMWLLYCLVCFVLFLSVHPDSSPLWIFCEPALVCSTGKVLWSFVSPHQCHRYLFLHFLLASCYCWICFQSVLAPGTSFLAEINIVPPALGFHLQQSTLLWHGKKALNFAHLEWASCELIVTDFFVIC